MDVLVEVHDNSSLTALKQSDDDRVNSRNLKTLDVNLETAFDLLTSIPDHIIRVAESGISSHTELDALHKAGYNAFLSGCLIRQNNIALVVQKLWQSPESA